MAELNTPETTVPFYELAGSPTEKYTTEGFRATRTFLVAWENREEFAKNIMGNASRFDYKIAAYYPNRTSVFPIRITLTPAENEAVVRQTLSQLHTDLAAYDGSWAKAVVDYETMEDEDLESGPNVETGTKLTYRLNYEAVDEILSAEGWTWADTGVSLPSDTLVTQRIPQTIHQLVWSQVVSPPWSAILAAQGKLNQDTFLDCPAGTLLLEGIAANKLYRSTFEEGESNFCWAITFTFRQRAVHHNGGTYGWNYLFRSTTGSWVMARNNGNPLYETTDFNALFQTE
ncbi:MAG: hypothetical protein Q4D98_02445 [Planctomycetia bacterium]|nr:hypothetical protein [Planctomycetia bacterium]